MSSRKRRKTGVRAEKSSVPPRAALESRIDKNSRQIVLAALGLNLLLCLVLFDPKPHTGGDNAGYIILAESILRRGDGYASDISPGPPVPETLHPFGYPLLLAPLVALFGRSLVVLKSLSVLFSAGSVLIFALLARKLLRPVKWAALTLALAVNPVIVDYSHWILSEIAFLFFSLLTLYLLLRDEREGARMPGLFFWTGVLALAYTYHIRSIGVGFVVAAFAGYLLKRSWRRLALFTVAVAVLLAPWMIRNRIVSHGAKNYGQWLLLKNPYNPEGGSIALSGLPARLVENVKIYSTREMIRAVFGPDTFFSAERKFFWIGVLFSLLILLGLADNLRGGFRLLEIYFLVYLGVVLIWPEVWSDVRFVMPMIPFFLLYLADGVGAAARWMAPKLDPGAGLPQAAAVCLVALAGLLFQGGKIPENLRQVRNFLLGDRYAGYPLNWRYFYQAADWVKANTPDSSVITVRKPTLLYIHAGRKVINYSFTTDADSVFAEISKSDYVIIDAVSGTTYRYLIPAVEKHPECFKLVYSTPQPFTAVLEVVP